MPVTMNETKRLALLAELRALCDPVLVDRAASRLTEAQMRDLIEASRAARLLRALRLLRRGDAGASLMAGATITVRLEGDGLGAN